MIKLGRQHFIAVLIALLAIVRSIYVVARGLLAVVVFALAVAACLHNVGVVAVPYIGLYLEKVPVDASVTLVGILLATFGALSVWRRQKKEELLATSVDEVASFFDQALQTISVVHVYIHVLKQFQDELAAGPHPISSLWRASYLSGQVEGVKRALDSFHQSAIRVHGVDGKYVQILTVHRTMFNSFKAAKEALLELSDRAYLSLPKAYEDPADFIAFLRLVPIDEYDAFLGCFTPLTSAIAGGAGGVRATAYARFFPPTMTFARAIFNVDRDP